MRIRVKESKTHEHVSLLYTGVEWLPKYKGVQSSPLLFSQRHDDIQVAFHHQVEVCLQAAQGAERLLSLLPEGGEFKHKKSYITRCPAVLGQKSY